MGCGITFMCGMGVNALVGYKDVQINPNKRGATLQTWGNEERRGVVQHLKEGKVNPEGLGVNHSEYVTKRDQYMKE